MDLEEGELDDEEGSLDEREENKCNNMIMEIANQMLYEKTHEQQLNEAIKLSLVPKETS